MSARTIAPLAVEQLNAIIAALDERAITLQGRIRRAANGDPEILARYQGQLADVESVLVLVLAAMP